MTSPMSTHDRFEAASPLWYLAFDGGIGLLGVMSVSEGAYEAVSAKLPMPSRDKVQALFYGSVALHVAEAAMAYRMARRRGMRGSAARYARHAFIVGFPTLLQIRRIGRTAAPDEAVSAPS